MRCNNRGFNTIELMMGVAVLAIVALAGVTLAQVADRATNYPDRKMELHSLSAYIMENLKNEKSCTESLSGITLAAGRNNPNSLGNAYGHSGRGVTGNDGRSIPVRIPDLQLGTNMQGTIWDPADPNIANKQILPRRLEIRNIRLKDGVLLNDDGTNRTYLANVYLEAREIDGISFKEQMIGSITIVTNQDDDLQSCQSVPSSAVREACEGSDGMGCVWDPNAQPSCRCLVVQEVCSAPGYYPTSFELRSGENFARPVCTPLGSREHTCSGNEYLTGVGIGQIYCAPVPTTCPTGSSTTGAGNAIPGLISCRCNNSGESWDGNSCEPATTSCPSGTSTTNTGGESSTTGCFCPSGQLWNSSTSSCYTPTITAACGSSDGGTYTTAPTTNLCSVGTASAVTGTGPWSWTCTDSTGSVNCSGGTSSSVPINGYCTVFNWDSTTGITSFWTTDTAADDCIGNRWWIPRTGGCTGSYTGTCSTATGQALADYAFTCADGSTYNNYVIVGNCSSPPATQTVNGAPETCSTNTDPATSTGYWCAGVQFGGAIPTAADGGCGASQAVKDAKCSEVYGIDGMPRATCMSLRAVSLSCSGTSQTCECL